MRHNQRAGNVIADEAPGLAYAFRRPALRVQVDAILTTGEERSFGVLIPDSLAALSLKAHAWKARRKDTDAYDVWRCLELVDHDQLTRADGSDPLVDLEQVLREDFARNGAGTADAISYRPLSSGDEDVRRARIEALASKVLRS